MCNFSSLTITFSFLGLIFFQTDTKSQSWIGNKNELRKVKNYSRTEQSISQVQVTITYLWDHNGFTQNNTKNIITCFKGSFYKSLFFVSSNFCETIIDKFRALSSYGTRAYVHCGTQNKSISFLVQKFYWLFLFWHKKCRNRSAVCKCLWANKIKTPEIVNEFLINKHFEVFKMRCIERIKNNNTPPIALQGVKVKQKDEAFQHSSIQWK